LKRSVMSRSLTSSARFFRASASLLIVTLYCNEWNFDSSRGGTYAAPHNAKNATEPPAPCPHHCPGGSPQSRGAHPASALRAPEGEPDVDREYRGGSAAGGRRRVPRPVPRAEPGALEGYRPPISPAIPREGYPPSPYRVT